MRSFQTLPAEGCCCCGFRGATTGWETERGCGVSFGAKDGNEGFESWMGGFLRLELAGMVDDRVLVVSGEDTDRGVTVAADREGPSFDAARALLSMNFLYSYFAAMNSFIRRLSLSL